MANAIKYSITGLTQSLKKGNLYIGIGEAGKGPSNTTMYYNGVTPTLNGYTVYFYNPSQPSNISYRSASNDSELIIITNNLSNQDFTTISECLVWYSTQSNYSCVNKEYENIVTDGLVLNLDAGFINSYPRSGATWSDISSGGNNGTLVNGPTYSSDGSGSMVFDGVDDSVSIPSNSSLQVTKDQTLVFWVYPERRDRRQNFYNKAYGGEGTITYEPSGYLNYYWGTNGNNGAPYQGVSSLPIMEVLNTWYFIVLVRELSTPTKTIKWYFNGVLSNSTTAVYSEATAGNNPITIGTGYAGSFLGKVGITQIYNRALSTTEVLQNYQVMLSRFTGDNIVMDGIVLYLDAGYNGSYIGSGTTWNDISGYGNNGTLVNGVTYSSLNGGSLVFDGVNDYVTGVCSLTGQNITINLWCYPTTTGVFRTPLTNDIYNSGMTGYSIQQRNNGTFWVSIGSWGIGSDLVGDIPYTTNQWINLSMTYNGTTLSAYKNGKFFGSTPCTRTFSAGTLIVGAGQGGATEYFSGNITSTQIYNRPLSPTEILQSYQTILPRYTGNDIIMDGLVLYLDAGYNGSYIGTGTTWNDISGYGDNGTLVNGVTYSTDYSGSMVFDGVDDYVTIPSSEKLKTLGLQNFTISLWVKRTTLPPGGNGEMLFVNSGVGGVNGGGIVIGIASTTCRIELRDNSGQATAIAPEIGFQANTWTNIVVVKVGTSMIIYSQGVIKSTIDNLYQNISTSITTVELGRVYWWSGGNWEGNISTTQIYNRALIHQEILQNYEATKSRYGL